MVLRPKPQATAHPLKQCIKEHPTKAFFGDRRDPYSTSSPSGRPYILVCPDSTPLQTLKAIPLKVMPYAGVQFMAFDQSHGRSSNSVPTAFP